MEKAKYERIPQDDDQTEEETENESDRSECLSIAVEEDEAVYNESNSSEKDKTYKKRKEEIRLQTIGLTEKKLLLR